MSELPSEKLDNVFNLKQIFLKSLFHKETNMKIAICCDLVNGIGFSTSDSSESPKQPNNLVYSQFAWSA